MFQKSCRLSRWKSCRVDDPFLYLQLLDAVALQTFISKQLVYLWPINKYRLFTVPYVFVRSSVLPAAMHIGFICSKGLGLGLDGAARLQLHSIVSKALQKLSCTRIPRMFCIFVCSTTSLTNLIFCPMYLPFRKPVWSGLIKRSKTFSNLVAMTFDAILYSTFRNAISQTPNFKWHDTVFTLYLYCEIRGMGKKKTKQNKRESVNHGHKVLITETESNVALEANSCMLYQFLSISSVLKLP